MKKFKSYNYFNEPDPLDYRDKQPFKAYCETVRELLSDKPKTVGAIKRQLGAKLNDRWLGDALDRLVLDSRAEFIEGYRNVYVRREAVKRVAVKGALDHSRLFVKGRNVREIPTNSSIYGENYIYGLK